MQADLTFILIFLNSVDVAMADGEGFSYEAEEEEDDEELYRMLEEDVENPNDKKPSNIVPTRVRTKHLVVEKGRSKFDMLPEGWVKLCHDSGLQVYLHRQSRVVSMSRPFFVGTGNARVSTGGISVFQTEIGAPFSTINFAMSWKLCGLRALSHHLATHG